MSTKVIAVCGAGPGVSTAVAEKFGKEGFKVALIARTKARLEALVAGLADKGVHAEAFPADAGDPESLKSALSAAAASLGPITVLHWNIYPTAARGNLSAQSLEGIDHLLNVGIKGMLVAVNAVVPGMKGQDGAAILTTNGLSHKLDEGLETHLVKQFGSPGLGIVNIFIHKTMRILKIELEDTGIFCGEVCIGALVKGSAFDDALGGIGTLEPATVAEAFWKQYTGREAGYVEIA